MANGGEYSYDNIQLVCTALNRWRGDTDLDTFIAMCKAVADYQSTESGGQDGC